MRKACVLAHYVITPIGAGSLANYMAVRQGESSLRFHDSLFGLPEPAYASVFDYNAVRAFIGPVSQSLTNFEALCVASAAPAILMSGIDASSPDVRFVISTTKANVSLLGTPDFTDADVAAEKVVKALGGTTAPVVVSNACISGLAAQIVAKRLIESGNARYVVVIGADELSRFIVSGFQSFKALSIDACRPFDADRCGLNLGEASATIIFEGKDSPAPDDFVIADGAIRNDANHISGPSRTGEGSYQCLKALNISIDNLPAFINAHGTATLYNDEMESIAITRAGLAEVPVYSLKGYFGHTLGAAGVLETIMSLMAAEEGCILPTLGFSTLGVSKPIKVTSETQKLDDVNSFVKLMSGFGGVNAAVRYCRGYSSDSMSEKDMYVRDSCVIDNSCPLDELYRQNGIRYPKFHKMDGLCKLAFIAAEKLLGVSDCAENQSDTAVLLVTKTGCDSNDIKYMDTISSEEFFPSPAIFVYTLPNIATGEIAIRHHFTAETSTYLSPSHAEDIYELVKTTFADSPINNILLIYAEYESADSFGCRAWLIGNKKTDQPFNTQTIS